ncbi:MAG: ParD-like family protein [Termitinemataceae bacterium]|nr:MAG: ParD-like family protein [Termitinemataceae bacterium]
MAEITLSSNIINAAAVCAPAFSRSIQNQIEHWARIGKIAEENPDMPYSFIQEILQGKSEIEAGDVSTFEFREEYS